MNNNYWKKSKMDTLSSKQAAELKGQSHTLVPLAHIGKSGFTETVIAEIDKHLNKRELIKVKVLKSELESLSKEEVAATIREKLNCHLISYTGNVLLLYREHGTQN